MLPDLVQDVPRQLDVATVRAGGSRRFHLGFRSAVENRGTGPLDIVARRASREERVLVASQLVSYADGSVVERPGIGRVVYVRHRDHQHFHFLGFETYELRSLSSPSRVRRDRKTGFCLGDRYNVGTFGSIFEPRNPVYTTNCARGMPDRLEVKEGISVGYGDDYPAHLEGQFVNLSRLPAGRYDLVHRVNVANRIQEGAAENNASSLHVRLSWPNGTSRKPRIRVLATCPGRPTCGPSR
jgi:hypothetical protein